MFWIVARYCRVKFSCSFCCCDVFRCFFAVFSFPVVGLFLQRGCVPSLSVDTVRYFVLYCFVDRVVITVRAYQIKQCPKPEYFILNLNCFSNSKHNDS